METATNMRGTPQTLVTNGNILQIWCSSPTGDVSDSHIFDIPCLNNEQAEVLSLIWRQAFNLVK